MRLRMKLGVIGAMLLALAGCGQIGRLMSAAAGPPPTAAVLNGTSIDEAGIDLIRDLFDVALYGVEALNITPRTPRAVQIARVIRQISGFLGAADAAQKAGSSANYNEALRNARTALHQFQTAIGMPGDTSAQLMAAPQVQRFSASLTDAGRLAIADHLDPTGSPSNNGGSVALR